MHRYYARRPWNVFEHIIKHYTDPGDIILDPFCGGGVTVVEGLKLRRKVIGVDLNPLATFITEMEVAPLDINQFEKAFEEIKKLAEEKILPLYETTCSKCKKITHAEWYEWSNVFECPICHKEVIIDEAEKLKAGVYRCTSKKCKQAFKPSETQKTGELLRKLFINCGCGFNDVQDVTRKDSELFERIKSEFAKTIKRERLWFPNDEIPPSWKIDKWAIRSRGFTHFHKFFTTRNVLANARLLKLIDEIQAPEGVHEFLILCFSGSLRFTNIMTFRTDNWQAGKPVEWAGHAYWVPDIFCELNVAQAFNNRTNAVVRGKEYSNKVIANLFQPTMQFVNLQNEKTCLLINQSSHSLQIPDNSVDIIITDPPFGDNVMYSELSNFYNVWIAKFLGMVDSVINSTNEAVINPFKNQGIQFYENLLHMIFKECHRILKKNGYMILTFHNKNIDVWMALHRAANRGGFKLPSEDVSENRGIVYQTPIQNYTQTFHTKASGSMLGDFILSFQRMDKIDDSHKISSALTPEQERRLIEKIETLLHYHGGADENTLMTVLVPFLMNDLHVFTDVANFNFESFLKKYFNKDLKQKRWFTKEQYQEYYDPSQKKLRPIDFVPAEDFTQKILIEYLKQKGFATIDELLSEIYTKLVNSHRPGIEAVNKVLTKYCKLYEDKKLKKKGYVLRTDITPDKEIKKPTTINQLGLFGTETISEILNHNQVIQLLAHFALELGYRVHIGKTEQNKVKEFRQISASMTFKDDFGIASEKAFKKIKEIDLLILQEYEIPVAFEVTTSIDTAREAINDRFRDLFTILPNTSIKAFIIVKDSDYYKAMEMLNSAANKKDRLNEKIRIVKIGYLTKEHFREIIG